MLLLKPEPYKYAFFAQEYKRKKHFQLKRYITFSLSKKQKPFYNKQLILERISIFPQSNKKNVVNNMNSVNVADKSHGV